MVSSVKKWRAFSPFPVNTSASTSNSFHSQRKSSRSSSSRLPCRIQSLLIDDPIFIEDESERLPATNDMLFTRNSRLFDPFNTDFFMFDSIRPGSHGRYDVNHTSLSRKWGDSFFKDLSDPLSSDVKIIPILVENRVKTSSVRPESPIIVDDERLTTELSNSKRQTSRSPVILIDKNQSSNMASKYKNLQKDLSNKTEEKCEVIYPVQRTPPPSSLKKLLENVNKNNSSSTSIDSVGSEDLCLEDSGSIFVKNGNAEKNVNPTPGYPVYSVLKELLAKENRQVDYIRGDGNCFFRAVSKIMYGNDGFHKAVRNLIVDIIATNKLKFAQFVDGEDVQAHVERMSEDHCWATTCEIYAAATLLQRDIYMYTPNHLNDKYSWLLFQPVFKRTLAESELPTHPCCYVTLCNTNGNHYDRIVPDHGGCNCFLPLPQLDGIRASVDLTSV